MTRRRDGRGGVTRPPGGPGHPHRAGLEPESPKRRTRRLTDEEVEDEARREAEIEAAWFETRKSVYACVEVWVTRATIEKIDANRGVMTRGQWLDHVLKEIAT